MTNRSEMALALTTIFLVTAVTAQSAHALGLCDRLSLGADSGTGASQSNGEIPYLAGSFEFSSRRDIYNGDYQYYWGLVRNETGYGLDIKWGDNGNPRRFFANEGVIVENGIIAPRCTSLPGSGDNDSADQLLQFSRKNMNNWGQQNVSTIFERMALALPTPTGSNLAHRLNRLFGMSAAAQSRGDTTQMIRDAYARGLPSNMEPYLRPDGTVDAGALVADAEALQKYFDLGFDQITRSWATRFDIAGRLDVLQDISEGKEIDAGGLAPLYVQVDSVVSMIDSKPVASVRALAQMQVIDGENADFQSFDLDSIGYRLRVGGDGEFGEIDLTNNFGEELNTIFNFPESSAYFVMGGIPVSLESQNADWKVPLFEVSLFNPG